ncbi:hypothetical protein EYB53_001535 [Candidatus Chloroploca sp. M-50]|uniref:Restriction endonuclease n=1 Tax=Candidatus Chloroploca mongolica TaxID=2528176 RepID=A0ABS4D4K9_9CHLR|nr:hypothetical protein [Candidatus Chloroploca mongolica]MBP1464378.1 hypothetical protein [Candidatus Chloroploca mongolica]
MVVDDESFAAAYGEELSATLNIDAWQTGGDLEGLYERIEAEVTSGIAFEQAQRPTIRRELFPRLRTRPNAPAAAGCYRATLDDLRRVHRSLLFNGAVEACDGTRVEHDTLPVTITQIGVCLVSYQGDQGSWAQRLYRRDLRASTGNALDDLMALLDNRGQRGNTDNDERGKLSELARRGIMTYAERAILTKKSTAIWKMGHGDPTPYDLLTGSGSMQLLEKSMEILRELILQHRKILFVPSAPRAREWMTLGQALDPLEYLIIDSHTQKMLHVVESKDGGRGGHYSKEYARKVRDFCYEVGPHILFGIYRTSSAAPPQLFFAHADFVHEAALIAMADSVLQEHRGFPMLIDLADTICRTTFGNDIFNNVVQMAYAHAGEPFRFLNERMTRA